MAALLNTLFLGAVVGSIYALAAYGLVLTYRTSGIFNFAQGAVGMIFAFAYFQLTQGGEVDLVLAGVTQTFTLPTGLALMLVVGVLAPAFGWMLDVVLFRRLRDAGTVVQIVATIGLLVALQGLAGVMWGASTTLTPHSIFSDQPLVWGEFRASVEQVASVLLVIALCVGLVVFLRYTSLGIKMRAVVDRPELAELVGIDAARISALSWAIATSFAAAAGILIAPSFGNLDPITLTFLVIAAIAAAAIGRLSSFPWTLAGGFAIGIAQLVVQRYATSEIARQLRPAIPFLVLFAVLFLPWFRRGAKEGLREIALPPIRKELSERVRIVRVTLLGVVAVAAPFLLDLTWQQHLARVPPMALIFLSLVVLSGFAGQISLCQAALAGFGAFVAAHVVSGLGWPFGVALFAGGAVAVVWGAFLAVRAATLSPLFLGFATLAFGAVVDEVAFTSKWFAGGLSGVPLPRPDLLASPRAYYLVGLAVFGAFALAVRNLRRGRTGLVLNAMRDNEVGLASLGVSVARTKFVSFFLSAFLAGLGGAMLSAADEVATPFTYFLFWSLMFLTLAVVGGIGSWTGALAGAVLLQLGPAFVHEPWVSDNAVSRVLFGGQLEALLPVFFGLGAIGLARNPHGVVEQLREVGGRIAQAVRGPDPESEIEPIEPARPTADLVTYPRATLFHRSDCVLGQGKTPVVLEGRGDLAPCPVCEP